MPQIKHSRGTAADLETLRAASGLEPFALYFTTDTETLHVATAVNALRVVQPDQVAPAERTAGTETAIRSFSPADVANMAGTHGGGGGGGGSVPTVQPAGTDDWFKMYGVDRGLQNQGLSVHFHHAVLWQPVYSGNVSSLRIRIDTADATASFRLALFSTTVAAGSSAEIIPNVVLGQTTDLVTSSTGALAGVLDNPVSVKAGEVYALVARHNGGTAVRYTGFGSVNLAPALMPVRLLASNTFNVSLLAHIGEQTGPIGTVTGWFANHQNAPLQEVQYT